MAKLVEILARELKGWPEQYVLIIQDDCGSLHGYLSLSKDDMDQEGLPYDPVEIAWDGASVEVTRAEWQAAVDALNTPEVAEWDGVGLPPIGGPYEYNDTFAWCACDVIAYANGKVVFTRPDYAEAVYVAGCDEISFRPIRTPEQIAAEERNNAISVIREDLDRRIFGVTIAEWIYEAGYRKQEPK